MTDHRARVSQIVAWYDFCRNISLMALLVCTPSPSSSSFAKRMVFLRSAGWTRQTSHKDWPQLFSQTMAFWCLLQSIPDSLHNQLVFKNLLLFLQSPKGPIVYYVRGGVGGFGGGYNFKTSPFLGGKFFTGKKHEGGQILWHSNSSLGNLKSVIYPRSRGWEKRKINSIFDAISGPEGKVVWHDRATGRA